MESTTIVFVTLLTIITQRKHCAGKSATNNLRMAKMLSFITQCGRLGDLSIHFNLNLGSLGNKNSRNN